MAKLFASEMSVNVCEEAIQITAVMATRKIIRLKSIGVIPSSARLVRALLRFKPDYRPRALEAGGLIPATSCDET